MTTRPTSTTDWGGTAVEPSSGQKAAGFAPGARPPAEWHNYLFQTADEWVKFLRDAFGDVVTQPGFVFDGDSGQFMRALALSKESSAYLNQRTVDAGTALVSAAVSDVRIVVVGAGAEIRTSDDLGETWTGRTAGNSYSGDFGTAHFFNSSLFVIAGSAGEIQTSPDGGTWTHRVTSSGVSHIAMASRGSQIVIVGGHTGTGGTRAWSSDGTSWSSNAATIGAGFVFYDVAAAQTGAAVFIAVGHGGGADRTNYVHRSTNGGASFTPVDLSSVLASTEYVEQVVWHEALGFIALVQDSGAGDEITSVITSPDGLTWTKKGADPSQLGSGGSGHLVSTTGGLIILGSTAPSVSFTSLDGETWARLPCVKDHITVAMDCVRFAKLLNQNAYVMLLATLTGDVHICGPWAL